MPIYDYKCNDCGSYYKVECPMSEHSNTKPCATCEDGIGKQIFIAGHLPAVKIHKDAVLKNITFDKE